MLIVGLTAILSFIAVYYYEEPTHHCPFCLLKKEYFYIGYALYAALFIASIAGISVGVIHAFRNKTSVEKIVPKTQRALCFIAIINYMIFAAIGTWPFIFSDFKLV